PFPIATGIFCLIFLPFCLHFFLRWLWHAWPTESQGPGFWKVRWTARIFGGVLIVFVAGISALGVIHQTFWLATSPEPVIRDRSIKEAAARTQSAINMKQMALAKHSFQ